jgi:ribosomal protein S18 acetylase RimI-like enzyme
MLIRDALLTDLPAIARVHVDSWRTTYRGIVSDDYLASLSYEQRERGFQDGWDERHNIFLVAEDAGDGIVGFAVAGPERTNDVQFRGELYAVYLLQSHQRRNVGSLLVSTAVERLQAAGFHSMMTLVLADNPACKFYERLGGKRVRTLPVTIGGTSFVEVVYGWTDIGELLSAARSPTA